MIKSFLLILAILTGVLGQIFIIKSQIITGLILTFFTFFIIGFIFFESWQRDIKKSFSMKKIDFSFIFILFSLLLSIISIIIIKNKAELSLIFFIIASVFMAITVYLNKDIFGNYGEINYKQIKMATWEKWFFFFFLILIIVMRLYKLNDFPPGVHGHEAIIVSNCDGFNKGKFVWHMGAGAEWPTTTAYQGLFFAKIFGWNIGSFRIEGAIWGVLSIIAFYFLARQLVSPVSAAFASVLYSANFTHLLISRNFLASAILLVAPVLGLYFLIKGIKTKNFYDFLISGIAIGLSLHGYIPGRVIPLVFLAWLFYLIIFDRKNLPSFSNLFWLLIGFFIIAGFIIFMAIKEPDIYWEYLKSVDPNKRSNSIIGYFKTFFDYLPIHSGMFHIKADSDISFHIANEPILDQISGLLFPLGFFVSLLFFFKPIPAFFIGIFIAGMIPSMLGGGCSPQPNIRRMIVALPAIYMLSAFASDIIIKVFEKNKNKILNFFVITLVFLSANFSIGKVIYDYFYRFFNYHPQLVEISHHLYIAGKEIEKYLKKYKDIKIIASRYIFSNSSNVILIPKNTDYSLIKSPEEFLFSGKAENKLIFLEPFYESIKAQINILIPDAEIELFKQKENKFVNIDNNLNKEVDPYNKSKYIMKIFMPEKSFDDFRKIICKYNNEIIMVAPDSEELKRKFLNKEVELFFGIYLKQKQDNVKVTSGDNKWNIKIDGIVVRHGNNLTLEQGIHYFNLKGVITEKFEIKINNDTQNLFLPENIFASEKPYGAVLYYMNGARAWDRKPEIIKSLFFYPKRFYDVTEFPVPFSVKFKGILKPDKTGKYLFKIESNAQCRIFLDNKIVFNNLENNIQTMEIELDKNKSYELTADFQVEGGELNRTFLIYYKTRDMREWTMLPSNWVYLY